jgi:hypothetical protein
MPGATPTKDPSGYFLTPSSPLRLSGMANPGGGVVGSCAGGFGAGGVWAG